MPSRRDLANAIRALTMDAVQKANSGHPGAPMGMADIAEVLWNDFMQHNPGNPAWPNRDRFVLSNGHGSMLLYSLLHLSGYELTLDDLKNFRQLHSKTPGHPEYGHTPGVETTTGPLGQGISNAVGMALAERTLAAQFNREGHTIVDHHTYAFLGDGCLMEGVSHEACSLAGTLGLGKLIAFYDANSISIDGNIRGWFTDNTIKRFDAYNWHVIARVDGHNPDAIYAAIKEAHIVTHKPSLIICRTTIGFGSPNKQGHQSCHGAPLGDDEIALARNALNWPHPPFDIPTEIRQSWDYRQRGLQIEKEWQHRFAEYERAFPELASEFKRRLRGQLPSEWKSDTSEFIKTVNDKAENIASRHASQNSLKHFGPILPELIGGSADLTESNLTWWDGCKNVTEYTDGNYIYYGVREFGMSSMMNGMAVHGGFIPYGGTFLMFSDYARNAIRMSALMKCRIIYIFTHDSIGLGEDGPTHQPVEQISTLRMIPNMSVWRPCDTVETAISWQQAVERQDGPSCLLLSRQSLPHQKRSAQQIAEIKRGAYILKEPTKPAKAVVIATGSEVEIAMEAATLLGRSRIPTRVISMPNSLLFDQQPQQYKDKILPPNITVRVAVEAGSTVFWKQYVGLNGRVIGIDRFGESAPAQDLYREFDLTAQSIVVAVKSLVKSIQST